MLLISHKKLVVQLIVWLQRALTVGALLVNNRNSAPYNYAAQRPNKLSHYYAQMVRVTFS
jgi:hypothetical protein